MPARQPSCQPPLVHNYPDKRLPDTKSFQIEHAQHRGLTGAKQADKFLLSMLPPVFSHISIDFSEIFQLGVCLMKRITKTFHVALLHTTPANPSVRKSRKSE
jgi:hypothetical protein